MSTHFVYGGVWREKVLDEREEPSILYDIVISFGERKDGEILYPGIVRVRGLTVGEVWKDRDDGKHTYNPFFPDRDSFLSSATIDGIAKWVTDSWGIPIGRHVAYVEHSSGVDVQGDPIRTE